jgi:integral membrane protein
MNFSLSKSDSKPETTIKSLNMSIKSILGQLRILAILEGISYLLLAITVPIKYGLEIGWPNQIVGMAHGVLFIAYCLWVVVYAREAKWKLSTIAWSLIASLLPIGTFVADAKIFKKEQQRIQE